ncbi:MAG: hypothetical protein ACJ72L_18620 [Marmoricola sp.]
MFDRVVVRNHHLFADPLDVGALAEAALFYGQTELVLGRGSLRQLLNLYGADTLLEFFQHDYVRPYYLDQTAAIVNVAAPSGGEMHSPVQVRIGDSTEADVTRLFREAVGKSGLGGRRARAFLDLMEPLPWSEDWLEDAKVTLANESLATDAIKITSRYSLGSDPVAPLEPASYRWDGQYATYSLDPKAWSNTQAVFASQRGGGELGKGHLLSPLMGAQFDLTLAATLDADLSTSALGGELAQLLLRSASDQIRVAHPEAIADFQRHVLRGRDIRAAVNSGSRDLDDVMLLLDNASRFGKWLRDKPYDADLVTDYISEATAGTWASSIPSKLLRFFGLTALGILAAGPVGTAIGIGMGAFDSLVLETLVKGWRPNQFVETELDYFVRPDPDLARRRAKRT